MDKGKEMEMIVRRVVDEVGGKMWVEVGSEVWLSWGDEKE